MTTKIKIALVTVTLSDGGAERVAAALSKYFDEHEYEVHHIVLSGKIEYDYNGVVHHLIDSSKNKIINKCKRFIKLISIFRNNQFDYVIDFRTKESLFQELIIHNLIFPNFIQTIHSFNVASYLTKTRIGMWLMYPKRTQFITVAKEIENVVRQKYALEKLSTIYNPLHFERIFLKAQEAIEDNATFIVAAGSMNENIKQFDVLIKAYASSVLPKNNIKLYVLGDGKLKTTFQEFVKELGLTDKISFKGNVANPFAYYSKALFTVSTSKYEGLPMVLLESLACETPVVSYNYASGPAEIIEHLENGLLVKNQDEEALVQALNTFVEDKALYLHCKSNALESVKRFELNEIGKQWEAFFKSIAND